MTVNRHDISERTPLIPKDQSAIRPTEPSEGLAPDAPHVTPSDPALGQSSDYGTQSAQESLSDQENQLPAKSADEDPSASLGDPDLRKRLPYILPAIAIGVYLSAADQTIIVSSYGKIGSELHALSSTSWIATAYFLTLTSFQPLYGKLSDIFGRKSCLLFAYLVFGIGCVACGMARNIEELIAARAFAGIGGGGMTTVVSILLSDTVTLRERGKWQGYINIIYASGASTGAPLGGILADYVGWRWAFLGQAPLCLVAFIAVGILLKTPRQDDQHWKEKLRRIDFLGAIILISAVFTLLLALDRGSNVSWRSTITLASLGSSAALFVIFVLVEMKVASEPFAPGHVIFHRSLFASFMCNFFSFGGWLSALFYIPLYFQAVDGVSATQAGVRLIPSVICGVSGSLFAGLLMQKTGRYYWLTVLCYTFLTVGLILILLFAGAVTHSLVGIIIGMCICAFSNGIGVTSTLIGLIANASRQDQAIATACSYLFRSLGSVLGISLSATVANQALRQGLESSLSNGDAAREIAAKVRESLAYMKSLDPATRAIVVNCYSISTRSAFGLEIGLVAGAAISAWFIKEKALGS
ncbi:MFS general substrate transporter [Myriangium duriaei CBS 260.36]|uniref:MFS general substrate transporter n=1 Tax=Myriangium duriaei CBS 260.36 TaxID=1168546 RepID=A0A9P4IUM9_9PEZI|nr:MFS general substrate transporter [Myriangium duriaei CBS 260.36]